MIVKIQTYPKLVDEESGEVGHYERMVECDTVYRQQFKNKLKLMFYQNGYGQGTMIDSLDATEKTRVFFMEGGQTIDRIDFMCN